MIIAFTGSSGSGKSTAGETLKAYAGAGRAVSNTKFAAPLYKIQETIYQVIAPAYTRPPDFVKDRKLLQWIGTEWGRGTISESLWLNLWKARIALVSSKNPEVIHTCDDCRFNNEADAVHSLGGVVVRITSSRGFEVGGIANHASEAGIRPELVDYEITNDGTIEEFKQKLTDLFQKIEQENKGE